ncbi:MAG: DUF3108 domain-containing protein [Elusimicrobia bacterium]|nr:DUF3108 domain-containing protein [Elusimicrobiota bacterium]MDE2313264.1 DUF3108 domain-containing protein [Elusimicrobiota bacterium]
MPKSSILLTAAALFQATVLRAATDGARRSAEFPIVISSAAISDPHQLVGPAAPMEKSYKPLTVFPEKLTYAISWAGIPVGEATLSVPELVSFNGEPAYHIVSHADSNDFADAFYKVRDLNEAWLNARTLESLGYAKKLREGHFYRDEWVLYDQARHRFLSKTVNRDGSFSWHGGTVPASVQDVLSSLYYVRGQKLTPGENIILDVNTKQNWPLVVHVLGRYVVKTPAGTFHTILVKPAVRRDGIFIQKGRNLEIWLTDDARKIPVLMRVQLFFGHVEAALKVL